MALTETQKTAIRNYLGYSERSNDYTMEGALAFAWSATAETEIGLILTDIQSIETLLQAAWTHQVAEKAEEVTLQGEDEIIAQSNEGNRLIRNLATLLDVPIQRRFFSSSTAAGFTHRG